MNRRLLTIIAAISAALVIAAVAVWWFVLRSNAPPPVSLDEAVAAVTSEAPDEPASTVATTEAATEATGVVGDWSTKADNGSFAGYRVEEELARIGFTTAAGRTKDVNAVLTIEDGAVTVVTVTVNMQTLQTDDDRRDRAIRSQALETNTFPTASFTLTEPVLLPETAADGNPFAITAIGDLELHGVTRSVEIPLEAQLIDDVIAVIGTADILFEDYDISPPSAPILLGVDDHGEMEFQLLFERS
jgi:polyisoprenoid-binding protein YceI